LGYGVGLQHFSELKFLVDGWTWSVDQVPIFIKAIALAIGRRVSDIVGGYVFDGCAGSRFSFDGDLRDCRVGHLGLVVWY
jgi:hypothetical protein